jgi:hypothetical protein
MEGRYDNHPLVAPHLEHRAILHERMDDLQKILECVHALLTCPCANCQGERSMEVAHAQAR